jgi:hypothetical protein
MTRSDIGVCTATFAICMAASSAAVWGLEPPYITYHVRAFSLGSYIVLACLAFFPKTGILAGAMLANVTANEVWMGIPDYIEVGHHSFNVADILIVAGVLTFAVAVVKRLRIGGERRQGNRRLEQIWEALLLPPLKLTCRLLGRLRHPRG